MYNGVGFSIFTAQARDLGDYRTRSRRLSHTISAIVAYDLDLQALARLPPMRAETMHALVVISGAAHTVLCASRSALAEQPSDGVLHLQWAWSLTDIMWIANVIMLGAYFATVADAGEAPFLSSPAVTMSDAILIICPGAHDYDYGICAGNEPLLTSSFAAGLSVRLAAAPWLPVSTPVAQLSSSGAQFIFRSHGDHA